MKNCIFPSPEKQWFPSKYFISILYSSFSGKPSFFLFVLYRAFIRAKISIRAIRKFHNCSNSMSLPAYHVILKTIWTFYLHTVYARSQTKIIKTRKGIAGVFRPRCPGRSLRIWFFVFKWNKIPIGKQLKIFGILPCLLVF